MNPVVLSSESSFIATFLASFLIWFMFGGLAFLWLIDGKIKKEIALHAVLATLIAWGLSQMIKSFFPTIRPFGLNGTNPLTITVPTDGSFPSGHTAAAFGLAVSIWLHNKKLGYKFISIALLIGLGRILGNVHFFTDVLAGAMLGYLAAYLVEKLHPVKI
ncbi:hypothetical protein A2955_02110 [Candidatus Woesebacteria bacterium RIFCSPLOWO2_01_FULL_37_19]|uniref:Phosphatidic acid phosphatase type 2/haloperoxidase domain-containing protein n=2 Tax=Candidatus Woeseibacteriota TaxID=1752722 RepID=A0A1F8B6Y1_9BACT|nr:MAG: hypothetical protein A2771_00800 [Candidatus Woesebacteria bacterium RIFCSPHIGHO2_01_FULL_38_26b]OGM59761.1 MAG: hypothetical protein A2955_02110 [Candidatus Woesebacteria bacterium RIFCSPLOWO2_01_FULL_37_19]